MHEECTCKFFTLVIDVNLTKATLNIIASMESKKCFLDQNSPNISNTSHLLKHKNCGQKP